MTFANYLNSTNCLILGPPQAGASTCGCTRSLWQPLHYAAQHGHQPVIQLLLSCGDQADAPNKVPQPSYFLRFCFLLALQLLTRVAGRLDCSAPCLQARLDSPRGCHSLPHRFAGEAACPASICCCELDASSRTHHLACTAFSNRSFDL